MAYDIKAVKQQWEGHETPLVWGRYPVEHEPIRRHCHMLDDTNPRFLEDGDCPPVMVDFFASLGPSGLQPYLPEGVKHICKHLLRRTGRVFT